MILYDNKYGSPFSNGSSSNFLLSFASLSSLLYTSVNSCVALLTEVVAELIADFTSAATSVNFCVA